MDSFLCGTAVCMDLPGRAEMAAAICLPGLHTNRALSGDAILRINFPHPYSIML